MVSSLGRRVETLVSWFRSVLIEHLPLGIGTLCKLQVHITPVSDHDDIQLDLLEVAVAK